MATDDFQPLAADDFAPNGSQPAGTVGSGDQPPSDPGFWTELYNKNVAPMGQLAKGIYQSAQQAGQKGGTSSMLWGPKTIWDIASGMAKGAWSESHDEVEKAMDAYSKGNIASGIGHTLGAVPIIGPPTAEAADAVNKGQYGKAGADYLSILGQMFGPEAVKAATKPERMAGKLIYQGKYGGKGLFDFGSDVSLQDRPKITQMAQDMGLKLGGKEGMQAIDHLGDTTKPETFLGQQEAGVQANLGAARGKKVNWDTVLKPINDEINELDPRAPGATSRRQALIDARDQFKKQNGWKPAQINAKGIMTKPETPMNPLSVEDAQKLKRTTYRLNSPALYADTAPLPPAEKAANVLHARGLKDAIEEQAPGVKPFNDKMHTAIQLQDHLIDVAKSYPGFFREWGKWIGGSALTAALGVPLGEATGHPLASMPFIASALGAKATMDPLVGSRLGLALQHAGTGPISLMLGLTPRAARAGQILANQQKPQESQ